MHDNPREELAYIAGLFDGEGSIMIMRQASPAFMVNRIHPNYHVALSLGMIYKPAVERMVRALGLGRVYCEKSYHFKRPMYRWHVASQSKAIEVINTLLPWLDVKKEQALLALDFFRDCRWKTGHPVPNEVNEKRGKYWLKMRELNGIENSPATTERGGRLGRPKSIRA